MTDVEADQALENLKLSPAVFVSDVPSRLIELVQRRRQQTGVTCNTSASDQPAIDNDLVEAHWAKLDGDAQTAWMDFIRALRPNLAIDAKRQPRHEIWIAGGAACAAYDSHTGRLYQPDGTLAGEWGEEAARLCARTGVRMARPGAEPAIEQGREPPKPTNEPQAPNERSGSVGRL